MPSSHRSPSVPALNSRLVFLDFVRILAFGLLVLYHVGMYYVGWDWHIKSPHASAALEPWMRLVSPWRMDLLFLVSGAATSFMLARSGADAALLTARAKRLLVPLLFGVLVIVPPQSYLEVAQKYSYASNAFDFMQLYLGAYGGFCGSSGRCLILPTWNHLWFLPYLFSYTLVLWSVLRLAPSLLTRLAARSAAVLVGARLFVLPVLLLALTRFALREKFPVTHALVDDWFAHTQYFVIFVLGAVLARAPEVWERFSDARWIALVLGLSAWAGLVWPGTAAPGVAGSASWLLPVPFSVQQWCGVVTVLGFARRHLNRDGALRRYFTDAVFPVYIVHQSATIVFAHALAPAQLSATTEGALLVIGTFAASFLAYECVRRVAWARPLFGLGRAPPKPLRYAEAHAQQQH
ncbi:MAG: acyltransferase family protein [Burkholderiaceae bacterium]